jgi:hypothetical protein
MCINNVRQELHTLVHTQGADGLLHLYRRLEKRGRALLLCLLCAEAGWPILVNVGLRLERAYLKLRLVLRVYLQQPSTEMARSARRCCMFPATARRPTRLRRRAEVSAIYPPT